MTFFETARQYLLLGFTHVIPYGFDHMLFMLCVFFTGNTTKRLIIYCTVFTVAHSISLALASLDIIHPNIKIIEPLIAFSILFTAILNIINKPHSKLTVITIFIFGLIHGLGFSGALQEAGLAAHYFFTSLFFFNIGVECGQLLLILVAHYAVAKWFHLKPWYKSHIVCPVSGIIACIALYWVVQRVLTI